MEDFIIEDGVLVEYVGEESDVVIPDGVTAIGDGAFERCRTLRSITIPEGVTSIGDKAFSLCCFLTSIVIPDSVTSIGGRAFYNCMLLGNIEIPDSVTSIGERAFYNCSSLKSIVIPDSVTKIGDSAFSGTKLIQEENGVRYVGKWVVGCDSSLKHAQLRDNTVGIADCAFRGHSSLASINIPDCATSIGGYAFSRCSALENIIVEQGNPIYHSAGNCIIETKSKKLIAGCKNSVIPADGCVTSIGDYAFLYCDSLTSITIPEGVTSIGEGAFWGCRSLTSITIPDSVTEIESWAFSGCDSLKTIEYTGTEEQWENVERGEDWKPKDTQVICTGTYSGNSKSI